jgi:hypothetical protein
LQVGPFSPGIFAVNNLAIAINSDGSLALPAGAIPGISSHPAKIGDPGGLVILCTQIIDSGSNRNHDWQKRDCGVNRDRFL